MSVLRFSGFLLCMTCLGTVGLSASVHAQDEQVPQIVDSSTVAVPDTGELNTVNEDRLKKAGSASTRTISAPSALSPEMNNDDFFDANDLVPQGEMSHDGPIRVDPSTQPASKYIVVQKNYDAGSKTAQLVSAERAMKLGRYDSSLQLFDDLYAANEKDSRVLMGRAVVLQKLGRFDEAMGMYEKLEKVEPDNVDAQVNMLGLLATRYPSVALRRLLDLQEKNRSHVGLIAQIAISYANIGDMESALKYLGMAASMEPNIANHMFNMAVIADRGGDEKQAVQYYEKALEVDTIHGAGRSIPRDAVYERLAQIR